MTNVPHKDTIEVMTIFKDFINNTYSGVSGSPIIDPLSDSGKSRGTDTGIASYADDVKIANFPKIELNTIDIKRTRMAGGKSVYTEQFRTELSIIYTCHQQHTWTYNGTAYKGKQQCIRYLEYLADKIKQYSGSFGLNELVIGTVSNPIDDHKTATYTAGMILKVDNYGKVGS